MGLEDILTGALARGTNHNTLLLLNLCLLGCAFVCATLLFLPLGLPDGLLPHVAALLLLTLALQLSINWLVVQTGTVSSEEQRRELFGPPSGADVQQPTGEQPAAEQTTSAAAAAATAAGAAGAAEGVEHKDQ